MINIIVPLLVVIIIIYGIYKKVDIFDTFLLGVKEGLKVSINLFPTIFEDIYPIAGWSLGISGNIILTTFDSFLLTRVNRDEACAILVIPSQRHISGRIVNIISIEFFPLVRRLFVRLGSLFIILYVIPNIINTPHI